MGRAQFDPLVIRSIKWHFFMKITLFWPKSEVMGIVCNGQSSEIAFLYECSILNEFWWKSSKMGSKIDFLTKNDVFPGGDPGKCENRKFVMGRAQEKIVKLPKVYGFWRFFSIFNDFLCFSSFFIDFEGFDPFFC